MAIKTNTKYQADDDSIHPIRIDSTRVSVAGTAPAGAVDNDIQVKVSKSTRSFGLKPRGVRLSRTIGTSPDQFKRYSFLPVLTQTAFNASTYDVGSTVTIDSVAWTVVKKLGEDIN